MKPCSRLFLILSMLVTLTSCAGLVIDSLTKAITVGKTYREMAETLPPPAEGYGRLFIYRTAASTKSTLEYGIGIVKYSAIFTVDDTADELIWEAFKYIDLPNGRHEITCGRIFKNKHLQRGENRIQISIISGADTFVRLDFIPKTEKKPISFQPIIVDDTQAREELLRLPNQIKARFFLKRKISDGVAVTAADIKEKQNEEPESGAGQSPAEKETELSMANTPVNSAEENSNIQKNNLFMSQSSLERLFRTDRTAIAKTPGHTCTEKFYSDGRQEIKCGNFMDTGNFRINEDQYCGRWKVVRSGIEMCFKIYKVGDNKYKIIKNDGSLRGTWEFK